MSALPSDVSPEVSAIMAKGAADMLDMVTTGMDRTVRRSRILDELAFDLREQGQALADMGNRVIAGSLNEPTRAVGYCRKAALRLRNALARAEAGEDALLNSMIRDGVTVTGMTLAVTAFESAARKLEGC